MKTKLQKYLSGSREGFSLVELIIVIAIMAILIGVVALAVLPYLNRSREAKDAQLLGTISSALSSAVATTQASEAGSITIDASGNIAATESTSTISASVATEVSNVIGAGKKVMSCTKLKGGTIVGKFDPANNRIVVYATTKNATSTPAAFDSAVTGISAYNDSDLSTTPEEDGKLACVTN